MCLAQANNFTLEWVWQISMMLAATLSTIARLKRLKYDVRQGMTEYLANVSTSAKKRQKNQGRLSSDFLIYQGSTLIEIEKMERAFSSFSQLPKEWLLEIYLETLFSSPIRSAGFNLKMVTEVYWNSADGEANLYLK